MTDAPREIWARYSPFEPDWTNDPDLTTPQHVKYIRADIAEAWGEAAEDLMKDCEAAYKRGLEEALEIALSHIPAPGFSDNPAYVRFDPSTLMAKKIAAAIRAKMEEGEP